jgi:hypothetical protein
MSGINPANYGPGDPRYHRVVPPVVLNDKLEETLKSGDGGDSVGEVDAGAGGSMGDERGQKRGGDYKQPKREYRSPSGTGENVDELV